MPAEQLLKVTFLLDPEFKKPRNFTEYTVRELREHHVECVVRVVQLSDESLAEVISPEDLDADFIVLVAMLENWHRYKSLFPTRTVFQFMGEARAGCPILVKPRGAPRGSFPTTIGGPIHSARGLILYKRIRSLLFQRAEVPVPRRLPGYDASSPQLAWTSSTQPRPEPTAGSSVMKTYDVWFATNRKPKDLANPAQGFTGNRHSQVHHGICRVSIPRAHRIGETGTSWWRRMLRLQFQDDHLKVRECRILGGDAFWLSITEHLREWPEPERMALAFIHGYNVDFKESVIRAAQIGFDLKVPLTALFSWPSKGATTAYPTDEASIEASEPFIQSFLEGLAATPGVGRVHVIAHSMGNRGVLRALERIASKAATRSKPPFGQIILAAPDVDRDAFFQLASAHQALVQGTTLYACSRDKALLMSQRIRRGYPRAGYLPPLTLLSGVDTIDASDVDLDLLGHGYVAQAEPVLRDIHTIFKDYKRPDDRFGLIRDIEDGLPFWKISGAYRSLINP